MNYEVNDNVYVSHPLIVCFAVDKNHVILNNFIFLYTNKIVDIIVLSYS